MNSKKCRIESYPRARVIWVATTTTFIPLYIRIHLLLVRSIKEWSLYLGFPKKYLLFCFEGFAWNKKNIKKWYTFKLGREAWWTADAFDNI